MPRPKTGHTKTKKMIIDSLFTPFITASKGSADAYKCRRGGKLQYVIRSFPMWNTSSHTFSHTATAQGAKICLEAWRKFPCQITRPSRFLFSPTSQTFLDWFREAYQGWCIQHQTAPPVPSKITARPTANPLIFQLEIEAETALSVWLQRGANSPAYPFIPSFSSRHGAFSFCTKRVKTYLTTFTQRIDIPAGTSATIFFAYAETDAFTFIEPTPAAPQLTFIPAIPNTQTYTIFSFF